MKTLLRGLALGLVLPLCSPSWCGGADGARTNPPGKNNGDVLLSTMQRELRRAQAKLGQLDPAPYFASYSVYDQQGTVMVGGLGSLLNFTQFHRRTGEVTMRVGNVALDNTHQENRNSGINSGLVPLEDDADAVARVLWQLTYEEYREPPRAISTSRLRRRCAPRRKIPRLISPRPSPKSIWITPCRSSTSTGRTGKTGFAATPAISASIPRFIPRR